MSCRGQQAVDLIIHHAVIYTVDTAFSVHEAIAVKDGKVVRTGTEEEIIGTYKADSVLDAGGKYLYPGFIDAHAHFYGLGQSLQSADLTGTRSWEEVLERLLQFAGEHPDGWLRGRGWDQNDWPVKEFPDRRQLDSLFPGRPVYLERIDGHAAIANETALKASGLKPGEKISGGDAVTGNGRLTGVLIDNAMARVETTIPEPSRKQIEQALSGAEEHCFSLGLTSVTDCGLHPRLVALIDSLQKSRALKIRLYAMLSDGEAGYRYLAEKGPLKTERLNVRSVKLYADGALGSRGACLLQPYHDRPGHSGFLLNTRDHFEQRARELYGKGFQVCTHAIGDSANREILDIYARILGGPNDRRWRIEHAQVVHPDDIGTFGAYDIIPSVQPTHATSDMYWAGDRLGPERLKSAYTYRSLLEQNGWIPLGTDFPVEEVNPMLTFYAAVFRKDAEGYPEEGFQPAQALTREQALRGMTIWAARSCFEENEKGSLEPGKWADMILMDTDLMKAGEQAILQAKVATTFIGGEKVYTASR